MADNSGKAFAPYGSTAWADKDVELLETMPYNEVAKRIRLTRAEVQAKRLALRIPASKVSPKARDRTDSEEIKLLFSPYHPPRTRRGKFLVCERRGKVRVGDYSDGLI